MSMENAGASGNERWTPVLSVCSIFEGKTLTNDIFQKELPVPFPVSNVRLFHHSNFLLCFYGAPVLLVLTYSIGEKRATFIPRW